MRKKKRCLHVGHLLTKHAREEQRPFHNTGSFDAYAIEEDTKKDGLITVLIFMS